jgi:hypothetical protein
MFFWDATPDDCHQTQIAWYFAFVEANVVAFL